VRYLAILQMIITGWLLGAVGFIAPAAASACSGFFSVGAAVCGDASVQGGVGITPLTETASPLLNQISGSGVAVGAVGTGIGILGSTAAYGSFGSAHIVTSATSSYTDPNGFLSSVASIGVIGFVDGFTVGTSALNVRLVSSLSGNFSGNATGTVNFSLFDVSTSQFVFADQGLFAYRLSSSSSKTTDVTLAAGNTYLFNWSMEADASAGNDKFGTWGPSTSDLAHTGTLNIDVLTPDASISFLSGANYSSISGAVPEPSTWVMMILGFTSICFMTYRCKSKPVLITA
jgi:hypothetical protein